VLTEPESTGLTARLARVMSPTLAGMCRAHSPPLEGGCGKQRRPTAP